MNPNSMFILFYGNCQVWAVKQTLNLPYETQTIECFNTDITKEDFINILQKSDIIITQPIQDHYREKDYLSTSFVLKHTKGKVILFDSCYFDFYYFDLTYHYCNNSWLNEPSSYHYKTMLEQKLSVEEYCRHIQTLKTKEELEQIAETSLQEMKKRQLENTKYNVHVISIYDFVKENYKEKLLFYSMNHPTKYVIQYICEEIVKYLEWKNTINYEIEEMNQTKCILYPCIQSAVHFDISIHKPLLSGKTDLHEIISLYYEVYSKL
jgi:hypothetical protein